MNKEIIYFRLSVFLVLASIVCFGAYTAYGVYGATDYQSSVQSTYTQLKESKAECKDNPKSTSCEFVSYWQESFDKSVKARNDYQEKARIGILLSLAVPITVIILFYSLRWILTGKFRPFIIRLKER